MPEEPAKPPIHRFDAPCQICGRVFDSNDLNPLEMVRPGVSALIEKDHPAIEDRRLICEDDLNRYRRLYTQSLIEEEKGELTALEEGPAESS
jgi:hypothetical protein